MELINNNIPHPTINKSLTSAKTYHDLIGLDNLQSKYPNINGKGQAVVILDTGINKFHAAFKDRIAYQYDIADNDNDASESVKYGGHGTNIASIIGSSDNNYPGVAPGVDLIVLKVFTDNGAGFSWNLETALQWIANHSSANPNAKGQTWNIASVNMSLGDGMNYKTDTLYDPMNIQDELNTLTKLGITPVAAAGNGYGFYQSPGMTAPAIHSNTISVGAVFSDTGKTYTGFNTKADYVAPDVIAPFSQRSNLIDIFAPGVKIPGASKTGQGFSAGWTGTSQAAGFVSGAIALTQQMAEEKWGRRLSFLEIRNLLKNTGTTIKDGDDEKDNVTNTGLTFKRLDVGAIADKIFGGNSNQQTVKIKINGTTQDALIGEYGCGVGNSKSGKYTVSAQDSLLTINGNTWQQINVNTVLTLTSKLTFDYRSNNKGSIHAIGVDKDNLFTPKIDKLNAFKLGGQYKYWGKSGYNYTAKPGQWQTIEIPLGSTLKNVTEINHLFFVNNDDVANPTAYSEYRNIVLTA